jgi:peptidoglycan/xylan/chitin deacetylase (PgdA/CDA1 family)
MEKNLRQCLRDSFISTAGNLLQPTPGIHVLASHFISPGHYSFGGKVKVLERFYERLVKLGDVINFDEAINRINSRDLPIDKPLIALSFDDGFEECEEIANFFTKKNINVAFFINSNAIEAEKSYYKDHFERLKVADKKFLTWSALRDMHSYGHIIGSHTKDHFRLNMSNHEAIREQIIGDKKLIDLKIVGDCQSFAWPYGAEGDINEFAIGVASKSFKNVFSSCNHKLYNSSCGRVLNRRHVEPDWEESHLRFFLSVRRLFS